MNPLIILLITSLGLTAKQPAPLFTDAERGTLQTYWSAAGRYSVSLPPDALTKGVWQVRLTPDGSAWLLKYQNAIGAKSAAPTVDPTTIGTDYDTWKTWVLAKIARDRRRAQDAADAANLAMRPVSQDGTASSPDRSSLPSRGGSAQNAKRQTPNTQYQIPNTQPPTPNTQQPSDPGPIPASLLSAVGNPPPFASAVTPMQHSVTFDDGDLYAYTDNISLPQAFAYYRFPQGVAVFGTRTLDSDLDALYAAAGMTQSEQRIARAVSKLEGSFESINTYDTGFVSVGFLQFITHEDGKHSLCEVLQREKLDRPGEFAGDFHRYGIDVNADGVIDVVDPATGAELVGPEAVRKLVDDKRLIAVFQRAGRHSKAFRIAQIQIAKSHYWPADDPILISSGQLNISGKVSDVIHSEAGIATLFDRKVNRGSCGPISTVVTKIMQDHGLTRLEEAAQYERDIITQLKYRADFLSDATLGQPVAAP